MAAPSISKAEEDALLLEQNEKQATEIDNMDSTEIKDNEGDKVGNSLVLS